MFNLFNKSRKRVNLFIIGEQKCGTTSLHELLRTNQSILSGSEKECQYFNTEKFEKDSDYKYYHSLFKQVNSKAKYLIDGTPDYFHINGVAERIYDYNKDARFIIMLRDPVSRFISAYNFYFSNVLNNLEYVRKNYFQYSERGRKIYEYLKDKGEITIELFLEDELNGLSPMNSLYRGLYSKNITKWYSLFPKNSFCILYFENLKSSETFRNEKKVLEDFLSLSLPDHFPQENVSIKKSGMPEGIKVRLKDFYSLDSVELKHLTNRPVAW